MPDTNANKVQGSPEVLAEEILEAQCPSGELAFSIQNLTVSSADSCILRGIYLDIPKAQVTGIMGPSGVGKSTLLQCLNRLTDLSANLKLEGEIFFEEQSLLEPALDVDALRAKVGMLFQQPVIFPKSIYENVLFGLRHLRKLSRTEAPQLAEKALREASLWAEVKDRLHKPATQLSVGQQQRLCLARTLAVNPAVILMDEPTSALDMQSTQSIESLILELRKTKTIILVTHDVHQARRVTDRLSCVCLRDGVGEVVETACCDALLGNPQCCEAIEFFSRQPAEKLP